MKCIGILASAFVCIAALPCTLQAKDNIGQVRAGLESKHVKVIYGKHIDHLEYVKAVAAFAAGDGAAYLQSLANEIVTETGQSVAISTIIDLVQGKRDQSIIGGKPVYGGILRYMHWTEEGTKGLTPIIKISRPNTHQFYVAIGKKSTESNSQQHTRLQNLGNSPFKNYYLDINGNNGVVLLQKVAGSGTRWKLTNEGNFVRLHNLGNSAYKNYYLDIDGNSGAIILAQAAGSGTRWKQITDGNEVRLQNLGNGNFKNYYLDIDGKTGKLMLEKNPGSGTKWRMTNQ